jgi:hypothetical protein
MPRGGGTAFLGALGTIVLTPVIVIAGLLAVVGFTAAGAVRLARMAAPRTSAVSDTGLAPVAHLDLDAGPTDITLRPAA